MGICACSAGNHAQGVAFSAAALDLSVRLGLGHSEYQEIRDDPRDPRNPRSVKSVKLWILEPPRARGLRVSDGLRTSKDPMPAVASVASCFYFKAVSCLLPGKDLYATDNAQHQGGRSAQALPCGKLPA